MTQPNGFTRMAMIMDMEQIANPLRKMGVLLMLAFLYCAFGRAAEMFASPLHLPLIFSTLAFAATLFSGGLQRSLESSTGKMLFLFTLWMVFLVPFSMWRGGSYVLLKEEWFRSMSCFIMVAGLVMTIAECKQVMLVLAASSLTAAVLALAGGGSADGRLALRTGHLSNPNDLAQVLLLGWPFWYVLTSGKRGLVRKALMFVPTLVIMVAMAKTGSRGAMVAVFAICLLMLFFSNAKAVSKLTAVVAVFLALAMAIVVMPSSVRARYMTSLSGSANVEVEDPSAEDFQTAESNVIAAASREQRMALLKQSILLTLKHPIFGTGPGTFVHVSENDFKAAGIRAAYMETHNAYTQVSSETGFIGLFLFLGSLVVCFRSLNQIRKEAEADPRFKELGNLAGCMLLSITGFMVTSFFSSIAYKFLFPTVAGLGISIVWGARRQMREVLYAEAIRVPVVPSPVVAPPPAPNPAPVSATDKARGWKWTPEPEVVYPPVPALRPRNRPAWQ